MQIRKLFNEKLNYNPNYKGKVSPQIYQQRIPSSVDDTFIKAKKELDKIISKCGDDLIIYPENENIIAKITNVNKLGHLEWPMPIEGYSYDSKYAHKIHQNTLEQDIIPHFKEINSRENNGIDKSVLRSYQTNAIRQALYDDLSPEDIVELRKDCSTLLKYQRRNKIGYEQQEGFPFSWNKVKTALEMRGIDSNPSEELLQKSQEARLKEQRKIENSFINRMKNFFNIKK